MKAAPYTRIVIRALVVSAAMIAAGCDQAFDPRATLDHQMVVYSVLSTDRTTQFVRVQTSYMSPDYNPLSYTSDNFQNDAVVSIKAPNGIFRLADTLLPRGDTSRYTLPLRAFVLTSFTPQRGKTYQVIVQSASMGQASATVTVPERAVITINAEMFRVLAHPDEYSLDTPALYTIQLSRNAKAFVGRLLLYYDVLKGAEWVEEQAEIPITSSDSSNYSLDIPRYPQLGVAPSTSQIGLMYRNGYYKAIINRLNERYKETKVIFKWTTLLLLQADRNLYEYYTLTHGSQDPYSIRLDEPALSSVHGALGMVGAYSLDSLINILPERFWGNR